MCMFAAAGGDLPNSLPVVRATSGGGVRGGVSKALAACVSVEIGNNRKKG